MTDDFEPLDYESGRPRTRCLKCTLWHDGLLPGTKCPLLDPKTDKVCQGRLVLASLYDRERLADDISKARDRRIIQRELDAEERGPIVIPDPINLRDFLAEPLLTQSWWIEGLLRRGHVAMMVAQSKAGKTTLMDHLIWSLCLGEPFLGEFPILFDPEGADGLVGLLDFEMDREQHKEWMLQLGIPEDRQEIVEYWSLRGEAWKFDIRDAAVRSEWAQKFKSRNVTFLVIDCLSKIAEALGINLNFDAGLFLEPLSTLLKEAGIVCCVLVHHMGHQNDRAAGGYRLIGWPDLTWKLSRGPEDADGNESPERFFSAEGRIPDPILKRQVVFDKETRRLKLSDATPRTVVANQVVTDIANYLHKQKLEHERRRQAGEVQTHEQQWKGCSGRQIETAFGDRKVRKALEAGVQSGVLLQVANKGKGGGFLYRVNEGNDGGKCADEGPIQEAFRAVHGSETTVSGGVE